MLRVHVRRPQNGDIMTRIRRAFRLLTLTALFLLGVSAKAQQTAGAVAVVFNGEVIGITITNNGSGYLSPPAVTLVGGGGSGDILVCRL